MNLRKHCFSLVELMVATAILLILMTLLFQIVGTMMKGWRLNQASGRVYSSAQVVFDQLNRDFTNAMAGTHGGRDLDICWQGRKEFDWETDCSLTNALDTDKILYNASIHMIGFNPNDPTGDPVEIHYRLDTEKHILLRAEVSRENGGDWDFIGNPYATWCSTIGPNEFPYASGVCEFTVKVSSHVAHQLPDLALVTLTVVDPEEDINQDGNIDGMDLKKDLNGDGVRDWRDCPSKRTFTRLFFMGKDRRLGGN